LNPTTNTGGDMVLPFFWDQDMAPLDVTTTSFMGDLIIADMVPNRTVREGLPKMTITVYAWMPDLKLGGPTTLPVLQSEMVESKLSAKLTRISRFASLFTSAPLIAPYAAASSLMAKTAASVALMFGYSRPPHNGASSRMFLTNGPAFTHAVGDSGAPVLALDPKCEVTPDTRVAGLDGTDEMALYYIRQRESYFNRFEWDTLASPGQLLAQFKIHPLYSTFQGLGAGVYCPTALAYSTWPFRYWRGTIRMRFMIVASAVHTGVLRFVYDAVASTTGLLDIPRQNKVRVMNIDLSKERDFTIEFPYIQNAPYLEVGQYNNPISDLQCNGVLRIHVMNELVSSATVESPVQILVFMSAGDDFETWDLKTEINWFVPTLQSQDEVVITDSQPETPDIMPISPSQSAPASLCVFYGDPIVSIRYLLKRLFVTGNFNGTGNTVVTFPVFPNNATYSNPQHAVQFGILNHFAAMYVGWRGSMVKKYWGSQGYLVRNRKFGAGVPNMITSMTYDDWYTNIATSAALEANVGNTPLLATLPWYSPKRFQIACATPNLVSNEAETFLYMSQSPARTLEFTAIGDDFSFLYYLGAPRITVIA